MSDQFLVVAGGLGSRARPASSKSSPAAVPPTNPAARVSVAVAGCADRVGGGGSDPRCRGTSVDLRSPVDLRNSAASHRSHRPAGWRERRRFPGCHPADRNRLTPHPVGVLKIRDGSVIGALPITLVEHARQQGLDGSVRGTPADFLPPRDPDRDVAPRQMAGEPDVINHPDVVRDVVEGFIHEVRKHDRPGVALQKIDIPRTQHSASRRLLARGPKAPFAPLLTQTSQAVVGVEALLAHLCSREPFCGSGAWDNFGQMTTDRRHAFTASPRMRGEKAAGPGPGVNPVIIAEQDRNVAARQISGGMQELGCRPQIVVDDDKPDTFREIGPLSRPCGTTAIPLWNVDTDLIDTRGLVEQALQYRSEPVKTRRDRGQGNDRHSGALTKVAMSR